MSACAELVQAALPEWSRSDIDALLKAVDKRTAEELRANPGIDYNEAVKRAQQSLAEQIEADAYHEKINSAKNALKTLEGINRVRQAKDPVEGLRSILTGTQRAEAGMRRSASMEQRQLTNSYLGGLIADLSRIDTGLQLFVSGELDDDIARALWQVDQPNPRVDGVEPRAVEIAKVIRKYQESSRIDANMAGAKIGKLDDYIARQSHNPGKIAADRAGWEAIAREEMDFSRMGIEPDEIGKTLDALYRDLRDGIHLKAGRPGKKTPAGAGRRLSKERVIHFKNADGWMRYNREFGMGTIRESVFGQLEASARATGLMRHLGPDHEMNYQRIVDGILRDLKEKGGDTKGFENKATRYKKLYLAELDGSTSIPGEDIIGSVGSGIRAWQSMSSLGGAVLSSVSDLATVSLGARYNDASIFDTLGSGINSLFNGAKSAERLELMADLGMAFDSITGKVTASSRFSIDEGVGGAMGYLQNKFFTLNLQNWWTDSLRSGAAEFLSANLARKAGKNFDELGELKTTLGLYGIDSGKWDIIRSGALRDYEGRDFLTPAALDEVPDEEFAKYLGTSSPARIKALRSDMKSELRSYFTDQNSYMVLTPDAAASGALKLGTQRGTFVGEAVRFVMQFKSFPFAFTQRIAGRELQQSGLWGMTRLILATSLFGYAAMTLKDLAKFKEPRDPKDPKTIIAAMQQGGGAGLYSDLLFSQVIDRRFGDAGLQLFGPTASDVLGSQGVSGIAARVAQGQDAGAASLRFVQSNIPGFNLFWLKPILDYGVFYHAQEAVNPGSLRRMEAEAEKRTGQEFLISPADAVQ
jgi:hypothetical protein